MQQYVKQNYYIHDHQFTTHFDDEKTTKNISRKRESLRFFGVLNTHMFRRFVFFLFFFFLLTWIQALVILAQRQVKRGRPRLRHRRRRRGGGNGRTRPHNRQRTQNGTFRELNVSRRRVRRHNETRWTDERTFRFHNRRLLVLPIDIVFRGQRRPHRGRVPFRVAVQASTAQLSHYERRRCHVFLSFFDFFHNSSCGETGVNFFFAKNKKHEGFRSIEPVRDRFTPRRTSKNATDDSRSPGVVTWATLSAASLYGDQLKTRNMKGLSPLRNLHYNNQINTLRALSTSLSINSCSTEEKRI